MPDTPTPTQPTPPPPSSSRPAVQPISAAELQAELSAPPPAPKAPAPRIQADEIVQAAPRPNVVDPKDRSEPEVKSRVPSFKDGMRKRLLDDKAEPKPAEPKPAEPKPAEAKPKPEPKPEAKVVEPKVEAKAVEPPPEEPEVPEDHLKVLPTDKPDTAKRIKQLLKKITDLEAKPQSTANDEAIAKMQDSLKKTEDEVLKYRRIYDWENDPELKTKYVEPIAQADKSIEEILKSAGYQDATLNAIKAEGGFAAFSRSMKTFPVTVVDPDDPDSKITVQKTAAELAVSWLNSLPIADAEVVRQQVGRQQTLSTEMRVAKEKAAAEARQYFESQGLSQRQAQEAATQAQEKATKEYGEWLTKTTGETDFLKDREVPADAPEEVKSEIESYNEFTGQLRKSLEKHPTTAAEYGQLKLDAAEAHHLRRTMASKDAEIAALKDKLTKTKVAMRTTPKGGSILQGNRAPEAPAENANPTDYKSALRRRIKGGDEQADA